MNTVNLFEYIQWTVLIGAALFVAWRRYKKQPWIGYCLLTVVILATPFCLALAAPALIYTPLVDVLGLSTALVRETLLNLAGLAGLTAFGGLMPMILIGAFNILMANSSVNQEDEDDDIYKDNADPLDIYQRDPMSLNEWEYVNRYGHDSNGNDASKFI